MLLLGLIVLARLLMAWNNASFIDTRQFVETARLILQGISPYHPETNPTIYKYPIQSPGMSLLSMPFCFTPQIFQNLFFFIGGALAFLAFTLMVFHCYGYSPRQLLEARWRNLPIWLTLTAILVSSPHLTMLRNGQNSSFAALLLFAALLFPQRDHGSNILFLGTAATMKYSLLTMSAPVLLLQRKRWSLCMGSFLLFVLLVLSVGLWLEGIVPTFTDYLKFLSANIAYGSNSYTKSADTLLHTSFFRCNFVNIIVKLFLVLLYFISLYNIWRRGQQDTDIVRQAAAKENPLSLTATEWSAFTAMTMCISYHRVHDGILFLPFLGVVFVESLDAMRGPEKCGTTTWLSTLCLGALLLFWAVPLNTVFAFEDFIGTHFPAGKYVFYYGNTPYDKWTMMFPLTKIVMLFTTVFLFVKSLAETRPSSPTTKL